MAKLKLLVEICLTWWEIGKLIALNVAALMAIGLMGLGFFRLLYLIFEHLIMPAISWLYYLN